MKKPLFALCVAGAAFASFVSAQPALTVYNQNFAVVRDRVPLDLRAGENTVTYLGATIHLEPDSVVLRDPSGRIPLRVLEQSYRSDTISQGLLLSLYEGKELDFITRDPSGKEVLVKGRVIRSGYVPNVMPRTRYGQQFYQAQYSMGNYQTGAGQPIIEMDGRLRFSLPGEPVFPALTDDAILKPQLTWRLEAAQAARIDAELSYVTGGMSWEASYNLIAPEKGDTIDILGWVTIDNQSGKTFENTTIKLMAGDVSKLQTEEELRQRNEMAAKVAMDAMSGGVTEKAFDEFHLYSLPRAVTLRNRETKQVEFIRATGVKAKVLYVYSGADLQQYRGWNMESIRNNPDFGTRSNTKVWVVRELANTTANGLGMPLPKGRTRFYRKDDADGRLEFTGENEINHTAKDETVRIYTGDAFDVVGERRRTSYLLSNRSDSLEESFEIKIRNHKSEAVEVRVAERLYRWMNWEIIQKSHDFVQGDSQNVEFRVSVPANGETVVTYRVRYNWQ